MAKTIVVCGYGPGISRAVAEKFGREGFQVALVARNAQKLQTGAAELQEHGIRAQSFVCDLSNASSVDHLLTEVRSALGDISVLHWNAYSHAAGDLLTCEPPEVVNSFNVAVTSLVAAVRACLPDLQKADNPAVLVTGGALSNYADAVDERAVQWSAMGLAVAKAAQRKTAGLLHAKLKPLGVYVGHVTVSAIVKGTAADRGQGTLEPAAIAERFWELYRTRNEANATIA